MKWLENIYRKNIYGVMGTLVFHILLMLSFLSANIDIKNEIKENQIIIDFPDIPKNEKEDVPEKEKVEKKVSNTANSNNKLTTNRASNLTAKKEDKFFNEEYRKEISDAKKLVSRVNNQLKKEVININDIKMPVETTKGMDRDSIKNVIYTGESNITYDLKNRYHISLPIPVYLAHGGGTVVVDIIVDQSGNVIKAASRKNSRVLDPQVFYYAELAASKTIFNSDQTALKQQKGTIKYNFVAQ
jgi:hypothetical protein